MPYLVDGDNLLGTWPGRRRDDEARRVLAFELARLSRRIGKRVVVLFDGADPEGMSLGPDVSFSGPGRSADDRILGLLRREADPRGWTVVTSDRSLADRCRHLGSRTERSDRFRKRLCSVAGREKPEREDDVTFWLETFGED